MLSHTLDSIVLNESPDGWWRRMEPFSSKSLTSSLVSQGDRSFKVLYFSIGKVPISKRSKSSFGS